MTKTNKPTLLKIMLIALLLIIAVGIIIYFNQPESKAAHQTTDDAYVQADITFVSSQVSGTLNKIMVKDNQTVKAGELLATIDGRDFTLAVDMETSKVNTAKANVAVLKAMLIKQKNAIKTADVLLDISKADVKFAKDDFTRYENLAKDGASSIQKLQYARKQLNVKKAINEKNKLLLDEAKLELDVLISEIDKANAQLKLAESSLALAESTLSYTQIVATRDGVIGKKTAREGAYITSNTPLFAIVPIDKIYITANYRETQLAKVTPGNPVKIEIDAFPGEFLNGYVDSLAPASGVSYAAVGPHNATGNFTKIVQRLPIRIQLSADQPLTKKLRVGMSVTTDINVEQ